MVKYHLDWSLVVYSCVRSSDLFLILGCMNSSFLYVSFSTLHSSSLWRTDTTIFAKFDMLPPSQISPPFKKRFAFGYQHISIDQFISLLFDKWSAYFSLVINCHLNILFVASEPNLKVKSRLKAKIRNYGSPLLYRRRDRHNGSRMQRSFTCKCMGTFCIKTVKPLLSGPPIKGTPSIKWTVSWVLKQTSDISFKMNPYSVDTSIKQMQTLKWVVFG